MTIASDCHDRKWWMKFHRQVLVVIIVVTIVMVAVIATITIALILLLSIVIIIILTVIVIIVVIITRSALTRPTSQVCHAHNTDHPHHCQASRL